MCVRVGGTFRILLSRKKKGNICVRIYCILYCLALMGGIPAFFLILILGTMALKGGQKQKGRVGRMAFLLMR